MMIIASSTVGMSSNRNYSSYSSKESAVLVTTADKAAELEFTAETKSLMEQMKEFKLDVFEKQRENEKKNLQDAIRQMAERTQQAKTEEARESEAKSKEELKLEILKKMLEALKKHKLGDTKGLNFELNKLMSQGKQSSLSVLAKGEMGINTGSDNTATGSIWTRTAVTSSFFSEQEHTAYAATGLVRTADGREINFNVTIEMSRAFCEKYESFTQESYILTDPLVINLDSNIGSLSDQKFLFDINADGTEEEISFAGAGSGFLVLDKNNDGVINDGSEMFGTRSGNGFADLAQYDVDGNGWIDEADNKFNDLKIWTKDENGTDRLISLREAGVGAIYLDSASTRFSLNDLESNKTNGVIQRTGLYLKESGEVGTIQHIDLAV